jgi:Kazal-type serine protease inhibitor-like protein
MNSTKNKRSFFWRVSPLLWASVLILSGCGKASTEQSNVAEIEGMTLCEDPRSQMCTMDYRPVCANLLGDNKTYSNGCSACSDLQVTGYQDGACE